MVDSQGATGKIVLITGGSRGIGAAIALRLAAEGYRIWLNYQASRDRAEAVRERIEAAGGRCRLLQFDVSDATGAEAVLEPLLTTEVPYGFVHNAGIARDGLLPLMPYGDWQRVIEVNLNSFFILGRLLSKVMIGQRQGRIVAVTSLSGQAGQAGQVNYAAAKAGLVGACKSLARELGRRGILVNAVSPGLVDTEMIESLPLEQLLPLIPLGRVGRVEEIAGVVAFLLSRDAGYLTGQVLGVNGGMYM